MAIPCLRASLTTSYAFRNFENFAPGDRVVYDMSSNTLSLARRGTVIAQGSTSSFQIVSHRISQLITEYESIKRHLATKDRIFFAANLERLNPIVQRYNALVKQNKWLNFLDYLLWIVTFGRMSVSCKTFHNPDLRMLDSLGSLETVINNPQLEQFLLQHNPNLWYGFNHFDLDNIDQNIKQRVLYLVKKFGYEVLPQYHPNQLIKFTQIALELETLHREVDEKGAKEHEPAAKEEGPSISDVLLRQLYNHAHDLNYLVLYTLYQRHKANKEDKRLFQFLNNASTENLANIFYHHTRTHDHEFTRACLDHVIRNRQNWNNIHSIITCLEKGVEAEPAKYIDLIDNLRKDKFVTYANSYKLRSNLLNCPQQMIAKPELLADLINIGLDKDLVCNQNGTRFCQAICNLVGNRFDLNRAWTTISQAHRLKLLDFLNKHRENDIAFGQLDVTVFRAAEANYKQLSNEEKPHFFTSLSKNSATLGLPNRVLFFDFANHVAKLPAKQAGEKERDQKGSASFDKETYISAQLLPRIMRLVDFTDNELITVITLCSKKNFAVLNRRGGNLVKSIPSKQILQFLGRIKVQYGQDTLVNIAHATAHPAFAIQLCAARAFEPMGKFDRSDIMSIFKNLKFYEIPTEFFLPMVLSPKKIQFWIKQLEIRREKVRLLYFESKSLSNGENYEISSIAEYNQLSKLLDRFVEASHYPELSVFAEALEKDQDPDLSHDNLFQTASEEQLDWFYGFMETNLEVNPYHLQKQIDQKEAAVPPLPEDAGKIEYEELEKMFDRINFTDSRRPDYVDPQTLADDGGAVSLVALKGGLTNFIKKAKSPKGYYGVPDPNEDPEGYRRFCDALDLYLKHIVYRLRKNFRPLPLIDLARAGLHCGGRLIQNAKDCYCQVTGVKYRVDGETLEGKLIGILTQARKGILDNRVQRRTGEVHSRNNADMHVGTRFALPAVVYRDTYRGAFFNNEWEKELLYQECVAGYQPTNIINAIIRSFDGLPGTAAEVEAKFRQGALDLWICEQDKKYQAFNEKVRDFRSKVTLYTREKALGNKLKLKKKILEAKAKILDKKIDNHDEKKLFTDEELSAAKAAVEEELNKMKGPILGTAYTVDGRLKRKWFIKILVAHKVLQVKATRWEKLKSLFNNSDNYWDQ